MSEEGRVTYCREHRSSFCPCVWPGAYREESRLEWDAAELSYRENEWVWNRTVKHGS